MYYETRTHQLIQVNNALEAAEKIKTDMMQHQAIQWPARDQKHFMIAVADGHVDNPKLEIAILRTEKENASRFAQVESITNGWIESIPKLEKYLLEAEHSTFIMNDNASLIIGKPNGTEKAWFECGCCGSDFQSIVKYQLQFDQDAGYGICSGCEKYYL